MKEKQALQLIKATLDQAIKAGVLNNIESAAMLAQAFQILQALVNDKPE